MPQLTTQETKWLARIEKQLRLLNYAVRNGGGLTSAIQFTIGDGNPGTPLDGESIYANPALNGKTIQVHKNGFGYLTEGVDYDLYSGGGIELLGGGIFSTGETYVIWVL